MGKLITRINGERVEFVTRPRINNVGCDMLTVELVDYDSLSVCCCDNARTHIAFTQAQLIKWWLEDNTINSRFVYFVKDLTLHDIEEEINGTPTTGN